jgi:hypothetical protein
MSLSSQLESLTEKESIVYNALLEMKKDYECSTVWTTCLKIYCEDIQGKSLSGVISSLSKKNLISVHEPQCYVTGKTLREESTITIRGD